jgi:effector-binding domain-containing protein
LVSSKHNDSTRLIVTEKRSLLLSLLSFTPNSIAVADADSLKTFIETPSAYYGFPLEITGIVDTLVVAITKRVPTANRATELNNMYSMLYKAIQVNHLTVTKPIIAHYHPAGKDSVDITSAIPVASKALKGSMQNNISFMEMPPKGRMVVGYFKGKYADRTKLYNAMDRYITDKSLKKIAAAYEEYLNNQVPENDSTLVEIKICSPVL